MFILICNTIENPDDRTFMVWLYQEFYRLMFSVSRRYADNQDDCEDIVQESLLKLIKSIDTIKGKPRCVLAAYIVSTTRNTAINIMKKKSRLNGPCSSLESTVFSELESNAPPLDELVQLSERKQRLAYALDQLSVDERLLLEGKYILDYSDHELAKMLDCKPSSIRMKLTRARRKAYQLMTDQKEGESK